MTTPLNWSALQYALNEIDEMKGFFQSNEKRNGHHERGNNKAEEESKK